MFYHRFFDKINANEILGMSVLKNEDNIKDKNKGEEVIYELPAVIRDEKEDISFAKAFVISFIFHPAVVVIILLVSLILRYLGLNFDLFKKPDLKPKDIEFVLVEKEAPPVDKNTKNRADKNSRAGGKHDPNRPESLPQPAAPKAEKKPAAPQPKAPAKKPAAPKPKKTQTPQQQQPQQKQQTAPKTQQPAPKAPAPKPNPAPAAPKITQKPNSTFNIPVPKSSIPQVAQPTAPLTPAPKIGGGGTSTGVKGGTGSAPAPTFSQSKSISSSGVGSSGGSGGRFSSSSGLGGGSVGNPSPGNPNGAPGIDAIKEPDFGPYMKELQRRIKMKWDPPKGNESKRVILLFTISRDGRLMSVKVHRSSGLQAADNAAVNAVKLTAPFRPLPPEFKGNSVDIQFTFDYNVLGASMH